MYVVVLNRVEYTRNYGLSGCWVQGKLGKPVWAAEGIQSNACWREGVGLRQHWYQLLKLQFPHL